MIRSPHAQMSAAVVAAAALAAAAGAQAAPGEYRVLAKKGGAVRSFTERIDIP